MYRLLVGVFLAGCVKQVPVEVVQKEFLVGERVVAEPLTEPALRATVGDDGLPFLEEVEVLRTTTYNQVKVETWKDRTWVWDESPRDLATYAGGMAVGGLALIVAAPFTKITANDEDISAVGRPFMVLTGATLVVGATVPLGMIGVRRFRSRDVHVGTTFEDRPVEFADEARNPRPYSGFLTLSVTGYSASSEVSVLDHLEDGRVNLTNSTIPHLDNLWGATAESTPEFSWSLSTLTPESLYRIQRDYLVQHRGINQAFDADYRAWLKEQQRLAALREDERARARERLAQQELGRCWGREALSAGCSYGASKIVDHFIPPAAHAILNPATKIGFNLICDDIAGRIIRTDAEEPSVAESVSRDVIVSAAEKFLDDPIHPALPFTVGQVIGIVDVVEPFARCLK